MHEITYAYLETTSYCNLHCTFCNRDEVVKKASHMSVEDYRVVLKKLEKHPIREIKLMGMGEPFMHPHFHEICRLTRQTFPDAFIISSTNCQFDFNENFKKALAYVDLMYLSIDGYGETYERFRPPAKWGKLLKFLSHLKDFGDHSATLAINYTINPENVDDIQQVEKLIDRFGLHELRLNIVQNWNEDESAEAYHGFTESQLDFLSNRYYHLIKGKAVWDFPDCFWVKNGLYMSANGDVKICCMNTAAKPIGNLIRDLSTDLVFSNKRFIEIRNGCSTGNPTPHCANCSYKELAHILSDVL